MADRPNILWIVTTQWRAQACGYAGDPNARTPGLDVLAAQSVNHVQAVTPHPFGPFARAGFLTGVPCPENGVRDYYDPLPTTARTVAHALGERGYATAWFGKWHLWKRDPLTPLVSAAHATSIVPPEARGGFAFWEGFESGFQLHDPWLHGTDLPRPVQMRGYQSDVLCARAVRWITNASRPRSTPWFAVVSTEPPHPPYDATALTDFVRDPSALQLPPNVPRGGDVETRARRELAGYYAHIEATDRAIGKLIHDLPQDTIVVLTSVHGDMHGAHGRFRKGWPHEESIRVPLLVRHPRLAPGRNVTPISLLDIPAMTVAWAHGDVGNCGRDFAGISMPSVVRLPDQCDRVWSGVRTPEWKVTFGPDGEPWLVFDLAADPMEMQPINDGPERDSWVKQARTWLSKPFVASGL